MTRRFRHSAPWLFSLSRCLRPTQRRDPVFNIYRRRATSIARSEQGPLLHLSYVKECSLPRRQVEGIGKNAEAGGNQVKLSVVGLNRNTCVAL